MIKEDNWAVMKKFFVKVEYRSQKVGLALYKKLLEYAVKMGVKHILLDTPSVAKASHKFYEKAGFNKVDLKDIPIKYTFPDRNSLIYVLDI